MSSAAIIARARARRAIPNRLARPLYWRLAARNPGALRGVTVTSKVTFARRRALRLALDLSTRQAWSMLFQGFDAPGAEAAMLRAFCEQSERARCVIDVGVNHGLYLYHAVVCCPPGANIVGLEANPALVESVNSNLRANGIGSLVEMIALTDTEGPVRLNVGHDDMVSSLLAEHVIGYGGIATTVTVPGTTLDSLAAERELAPELIKIDVESHEAAVLRGAERVLATKRPVVLIEVTPTTFAEVDELMRAASYRGRLFTDRDLRAPDRGRIDSAGYSNLLYEPQGV